MSSITVTAHRWSGGWELIIDDKRATQVRTLDKAAAQVIDFLDADEEGIDHSAWTVEVRLDDPDTCHRLCRSVADRSDREVGQSL